MRPIDADVVQEHLNELINNEYCDPDFKKACFGLSIYLDDVPAIEAEPVKHGKWEYRDDDDYDDFTPRCSICGAPDAISREDYEYRGGKIRDNDSNYCPNCGAKMEETTIIQ